MIQANELRIGNWILLNGEPIPVGWSLIKDIRDQNKGIETSQNKKCKYEGIPLTSEIIEKAGFEVYGNSLSVYQTTYEKDGIVLNNIFNLVGEDGGIGRPLQYVHQLQNLYFALTGTELNIEL